MADTRDGREKQARDEETRQRERELEEAIDRADEAEPVDESDSPPVCHYRNCEERAAFRVTERYQEETGHGLVTAEAVMCRAHADDESPTNLDRASAEYVFRVEPLPGVFADSGETEPSANLDKTTT
ncbi:hypothetical protein [Natronomonas sp. EA1]|uniref:hypothetical protein n=1 Tax=Natronomonas sp. EA1 TaxID=3421655 RepID=UPI003EB7443B